MTEAIDLLWLPACAALVLVGIHAYFGLHVLARGVIFVDLALAQIAALGATVAFMLGYAPQGLAGYAYSLGFTLVGALLLTATRYWAGRVSQEALIGVIYVVGAAIAFLLIDRAPLGAEHIKQVLTGNILVVGARDVLTLAPLYALIGGAHRWLAPRLRESGATGEFVFYACLGVVVTSSVALAGVLLVFSFLIMPAAIGVIFADRFGRQLAIGWAAGTLASLIGLALSYAADLPTGATMVCAFGASLVLAGLVRALQRGIDWRRLARMTRWALAALFALSAASIVAAPRADQPLLDALERIAPAIRLSYLTEREQGVIADARRDTERFQREAERLNRIEVASRSGDTSIDDEKVRRITAFLKSYSEMRKGEEFVLREVRVRSRERSRWLLGGAFAAVALLLTPGFLARVQRRVVPGKTPHIKETDA